MLSAKEGEAQRQAAQVNTPERARGAAKLY